MISKLKAQAGVAGAVVAVVIVAVLVINFLITSDFSGKQTAVDTSPAPVLDTVLYHWSFDEVHTPAYGDGTLTVTTDSGLNGQDIRLINGPELVEGKFGSAVKFNASIEQYIGEDVTDIHFDGGVIAFSFWAKDIKGGTLISKGNFDFHTPSNEGFQGVEIGFIGDNKLRVWAQGLPANQQSILEAAFTPVSGWNHYTIIINTNSGEYFKTNSKMYVNGQEVKLVGRDLCGSGFTNVATLTDFTIGSVGRGFESPHGHYFTGLLDDLQVYSGALSTKQIKELYTGIKDPLIASWSFDEGVGNIAKDSAGGYDGTLANAYEDPAKNPAWVDGKFGNAVKLAAIENNVFKQQYVKTGSDIADLNGRVKTFSFWAKEQTSIGGNILGKIAESSSVGPEAGWRIYLTSSSIDLRGYSATINGDPQAYANFVYNGQQPRQPDSTYVSADLTGIITLHPVSKKPAWNHYVLVVDSTSHSTFIDNTKTKLYVNGKPIPLSATDVYGSGFNRVDNSIPFVIGAAGAGAAASDYESYFTGLLDEIKIYNKELTQEEVTNLFNTNDIAASSAPSSASGALIGRKGTSGVTGFQVAADTASPTPAEEVVTIPESPSNVLQGVVAYWPLDEFGSPTIKESVSGAEGTPVNNPTWVAGKVGNGLKFGGSSYADTKSDIGDLNGGVQTFSFWANGESGIALSKLTSLTTYERAGWAIEANPQYESARIIAYPGVKGAGGEEVSGIRDFAYSLPAGWKHYAFVVDSSSGDAFKANTKLYVNGQLFTPSQTGGGVSANFGGKVDTTAPLIIGGRQADSSSFDGLVDEVQIYDRELSADEIKTLVAAGSAQKPQAQTNLYQGGVYAYWLFDEVTEQNKLPDYNPYATTKRDAYFHSAYGYPGDKTNPVLVDGKFGKALSFDGTDDYVDTVNAADSRTNVVGTSIADFSSETVQTISFWANPESGTVFSKIEQILAPNNGYLGWDLTFESPHSLAVKIQDYSDGNTQTVLEAAGDFSGWNHFVLAIDASNNNPQLIANSKLYVNGKLIPLTARELCGSDPNWGLSEASSSFVVGALRWNSNDFSSHYKGLLDEVQIYNRELSQNEVSELYTGVESAVASNWKFDEGEGAIAADSSGQYDAVLGNLYTAPDGTAGGSAHNPEWVDGKFGKALKFDANKYNFVDTKAPNIGDFDGGVQTFSFWEKGQKGYIPISKYDYLKNLGWYLNFNPPDSVSQTTSLTLSAKSARTDETMLLADLTSVIKIDPNTLATSEWNHYVLVVDSSGNAAFKENTKLYVNGKAAPLRVAQEYGAGFQWKTKTSVSLLVGADTTVEINNGFTGLLDDVRIYSRGLSEEEITNLFEGREPDQNPVANPAVLADVTVGTTSGGSGGGSGGSSGGGGGGGGSSGGSSGGGGGGGAAAPVKDANILESISLEAKEGLSLEKLTDILATKEFADKRGIEKLQLEVGQKIEATDAKLDVKVFEKIPLVDDKRQTLTVLPSAEQRPIKIFQITPSEKLKSGIKKAKIIFALTKTELGQLKPENIILLTFENGKWDKLQIVSGVPRADGAVQFTATTSGFSIFVVTTAPQPAQTPQANKAEFDLPKVVEDLGLKVLKLDFTESVAPADAKLDIKVLGQIPLNDEGQTLTALPSKDQKVLKIFQINPSEKLKGKIKQAELGFTLSKTELGGIDPSKIIMARFAGGSWKGLPTKLGAKNADGSADFTATTSGFSVFVVTTDTNKLQRAGSAGTIATGFDMAIGLILVSVVAIGAGVGILFFMKMKKKKK